MRKNRHEWYQIDDFINKELLDTDDNVIKIKYGGNPIDNIYGCSFLSIKDKDGKFFKNPQTYKYSFWQNKKVFVSLKYETKHNRF